MAVIGTCVRHKNTFTSFTSRLSLSLSFELGHKRQDTQTVTATIHHDERSSSLRLEAIFRNRPQEKQVAEVRPLGNGERKWKEAVASRVKAIALRLEAVTQKR